MASQKDFADLQYFIRKLIRFLDEANISLLHEIGPALLLVIDYAIIPY